MAQKTEEEILAELGYPPGTKMPADWYEEVGIEPPPKLEEEPEKPREVELEPLVEPVVEPLPTEPHTLTRDEYRAYQDASPEEKFRLATEYGYIPKGSEYVPPFTKEQAEELMPKLAAEFGAEEAEKHLPPVTDWGYLSPEQIREREELAEARGAWAKSVIETRKARKEILEKLSDFEVESGYDLAKAIREGKIEDIRTAEKLGLFDPLAVVDAQISAAGIGGMEAAQREIKRLAPEAVTPEGIYLSTALEAGTDEATLRIAGYTQDQINEAKIPVPSTEFEGVPSLEAFAGRYWLEHPEMKYPREPKGTDYPAWDEPGYEEGLKQLRADRQKWREEGKKIRQLRKEAGFVSPEVAYAREYGGWEFAKALGVETAAILTPPARALRPEITPKDIRAWEWAVLGTQLVLIGVTVAAPKIPGLKVPKTATVKYGKINIHGQPIKGTVKVPVNIIKEGPVTVQQIVGQPKIPGYSITTPYKYIPPPSGGQAGGLYLPQGSYYAWGESIYPVPKPIFGATTFPRVVVAPGVGGAITRPITTATMTPEQVARLLGVKTVVTPAPLPFPSPTPTPKIFPAPIIYPAPVPKITPVKTPKPAIAPMPTPVPASVITPSIAPIPIPAPGPAPTIAPAPMPSPAPIITPELAPTPAPAPTPSPAPIPAPMPTPTPTPPPVVPAVPWLEQKGWLFEKDRVKTQPGTIAWRQGIFWITMPPPYDKRYYSKKPPKGAYKFAVGEDSAYKTIQIIGGVPKKDVENIDIGIAIVDIRRKGEKELSIHFKQDVEDVYKGKVIEEKVEVIKPPSEIPDYYTDETGRLVLTGKLKKIRESRRPVLAPPFLPRKPPEPTTQKGKRQPKEVSTSDRYYLGRKLEDRTLRVEL